MDNLRKIRFEEISRFNEIIKSPELILSIICTHISNSGTLVTLAEDWGVSFGDLTNWLHEDKDRDRRYIKSLKDRDEFGNERILKELRSLALIDIRRIFNEDGSIKNIIDWDEASARAVAAVEVDELFEGSGRERKQVGWTKRVKFWDKTKSLELLGKNLKMFVERHDSDKKFATLEELVVGSFGEDESVASREVKQLNEPMGKTDNKNSSDSDGNS